MALGSSMVEHVTGNHKDGGSVPPPGIYLVSVSDLHLHPLTHVHYSGDSGGGSALCSMLMAESNPS